MSKKKRPNQKLAQTPAPAPNPLLQPVLGKDVFIMFIDAAKSIGNEVVARRAFADEIGTYLAEKKLVDDFNAWRDAKRAPTPVTASND